MNIHAFKNHVHVMVELRYSFFYIAASFNPQEELDRLASSTLFPLTTIDSLSLSCNEEFPAHDDAYDADCADSNNRSTLSYSCNQITSTTTPQYNQNMPSCSSATQPKPLNLQSATGGTFILKLCSGHQLLTLN